MPTLSWIQETAIDRYYETGFKRENSLQQVFYSCRQCSKTFPSIYLRDQHELEHPIKNPMLRIQGKEIIGNQCVITRSVTHDDIEFYYIDNIEINDNKSTIDELRNILSNEDNNCYNITYSNRDGIKKKIIIQIDIAKESEIFKVDEYFKKYFSNDNFNGKEIENFRIAVKDLHSVNRYVHGIVSYLHGIMAKDKRTIRIKFEDFFSKFNQATDSLKSYSTSLATAIKCIISFNFNDFKSIPIGITSIDKATLFFRNELYIESNENITIPFPVDYATAFIVNDLVKYFHKYSLTEMESNIQSLNKEYISQQDRSKLNFVVYKKAKEEENHAKSHEYGRKIKNDVILSTLM